MIRALRPDEHDEAASVLARAFFDDPMFAWFLPNERMPWLKYVMRTMVEEEAPAGASFVDADDRLRGVIVATDRGKLSLGAHVLAYARAGLMPMPRWRMTFAGLRAQAQMDRSRPKGRHWYVHALGVDPAAQGRGVGAALLRIILERADSSGTLAHLETTKPENRAYYRRFGFEVVSEHVVARGAPPMWIMQRAPARS